MNEWWQAQGYLIGRHLHDDMWLVGRSMIYNARLMLCTPRSVLDFWCYSDLGLVVIAVQTWDGTGDPPVGWHRHFASGRRRENGDPEREWVSA